MGCTTSKDSPIIVGKSAHTGSQDLKRAQSIYATKLKGMNGNNNGEEKPQVDEKGHLMPEEVQNRIVGSSEVQTTIVGTDDSALTEIQYAYLTQRGYYPNSKFISLFSYVQFRSDSEDIGSEDCMHACE